MKNDPNVLCTLLCDREHRFRPSGVHCQVHGPVMARGPLEDAVETPNQTVGRPS